MKALRGSKRKGASGCRFIRDGVGRKSRSLSIAKRPSKEVRGVTAHVNSLSYFAETAIISNVFSFSFIRTAIAPKWARGPIRQVGLRVPRLPEQIPRGTAWRNPGNRNRLRCASGSESRHLHLGHDLPSGREAPHVELGYFGYGVARHPDRVAASEALGNRQDGGNPPFMIGWQHRVLVDGPPSWSEGASGCLRARANVGREWPSGASGGSEATESRAIRHSEESRRRRLRDDGPAEGNSVRPRIIGRLPRCFRLRERDPERRPRLSSRASRKDAGASIRPCGRGSG